MSLYVLEGLRPWVIQRVSAIYIVLFILYTGFCFYMTEPNTDVHAYQSWISWLANPFNTTAVGVFVIALLFHVWIGMRDVTLDYVHNIILRILVLAVLIGVLIGCGLWVFRILLSSVVT